MDSQITTESVPSPTSLPAAVSEVEAAGRDIADHPEGIDSLITDVERFIRVGGRAVGVAATVGGGEAEIAAGEAAGEAIGVTVGWIVVVCLLLILVDLRFFEGIIVWLAGKLPGLGFLNLQGKVRSFFHWLDSFENQVLSYLGNTITHTLHAWSVVVWFVLGVDPQTLQRILKSGSASGGLATVAETHYLQREINSLKHQVYDLQTTAGVPHNLGTVQPAALPDYSTLIRNYQHVERQLYLIHTDLTQFNSRLERVEHEMDHLRQRQDNLASQVHDVRAVAAGWQDIQDELDRLGNTVTHFITDTDVELHRLTRVQASMAPLQLLQQPGIRGLKVLRQLEDTPCMCPKLPGLPALMPNRLALYEFITNG